MARVSGQEQSAGTEWSSECAVCVAWVCVSVRVGCKRIGTKETITVRPGEGSSSRRRFTKRLVLFCYSYTIV